MQESWLQQGQLRAVQAEPEQAVHRQLCAQVLGRRQAVGQMRGRDTGVHNLTERLVRT